MSQPMPDLVDPWRLAALGKRFSGRIPLAKFPRLGALLLDQDGDAVFELGFEMDEHGRTCVRGRVETSLRLECQRCLEPMVFKATAAISLALVESLDEMELLPDEYDPLLVESGSIKPFDLLEDELLLTLPQVPVHLDGSCSASAFANGEPGEPADGGGPRKRSPFAVLAKLKRN